MSESRFIDERLLSVIVCVIMIIAAAVGIFLYGTRNVEESPFDIPNIGPEANCEVVDLYYKEDEYKDHPLVYVMINMTSNTINGDYLKTLYIINNIWFDSVDDVYRDLHREEAKKYYNLIESYKNWKENWDKKYDNCNNNDDACFDGYHCGRGRSTAYSCRDDMEYGSHGKYVGYRKKGYNFSKCSHHIKEERYQIALFDPAEDKHTWVLK